MTSPNNQYDPPTHNNPWIVGFPIYDGFTTLDLIGALQMFAYCYDESGNQLYYPLLIASGKGPYNSTAKGWPPPNYKGSLKDDKHAQFIPHFTFQELYDNDIKIDMLFVPGAGAKGFVGVIESQELALTTNDKKLNYLGALKHLANEAKWYGCICTAALILASAGLFQGSRVTTHWASIPALKKFKHITVPDGYPRAVIDTDENGMKCFSGGGISSSSDLALALIQHISGQDTAERSQLINQYGPDPIVHYGDPDRALEQAFAVDSSNVIKVPATSEISEDISPGNPRKFEHHFGPEITLIEQQSIHIFNGAIDKALKLDGKVQETQLS